MGSLDGTNLDWLFLPFLGLIAGALSCFIGSIAWTDVRRGITDKRLFEAQLGAMLGGLAILIVAVALIVLVVIYMFMFVSIASDMGGAPGGGWD